MRKGDILSEKNGKKSKGLGGEGWDGRVFPLSNSVFQRQPASERIVNGDSISTKNFGKGVADSTRVDFGKGKLSSEKFPFPNISNPFKVNPS